ncbi:hypothetical protein FDI02_gp041 [Citrobacter phage Mordin]|uniref:Uncharacterized protein n=1 Tax=Citrobacter phage Mordin TaxID=1701846 RepID=A0A0K2CMU1_9CAUD|nr:hypothetical protein FDI02_gp041 [Citrobacter phage Mordin]ALA06915.1 hypothetical protein Mordin_99 [Citrobacter phage Mordin]
MNKVKESDKIYIYVKANPFQRVKATVTHVSSSGVVYFRPIKNLHFKLYPDSPNLVEGHLWAGKIYSTADIDNLVFTGSFKDLLGIALSDTNSIKVEESEESEKATFEATPTMKKEATPKVRTIDVTIEAPVHSFAKLPEHESRFTTEEAGQQTHVVDNVKEYFKYFCDANPHSHMLTSPQKKFDSMLTNACEDAKKKAEEFKEATFIADRVVNHGDIEYTVRMMLKAGLTPYQIAEEIQRQFYNAMVEE